MYYTRLVTVVVTLENYLNLSMQKILSLLRVQDTLSFQNFSGRYVYEGCCKVPSF